MARADRTVLGNAERRLPATPVPRDQRFEITFAKQAIEQVVLGGQQKRLTLPMTREEVGQSERLQEREQVHACSSHAHLRAIAVAHCAPQQPINIQN